jgi:hypothetical protein
LRSTFCIFSHILSTLYALRPAPNFYEIHHRSEQIRMRIIKLFLLFLLTQEVLIHICAVLVHWSLTMSSGFSPTNSKARQKFCFLFNTENYPRNFFTAKQKHLLHSCWKYFSKFFCKVLIRTKFENYIGIYIKQKFLQEYGNIFCHFLLVGLSPGHFCARNLNGLILLENWTGFSNGSLTQTILAAFFFIY